MKITTQIFIDRAVVKHGAKYDYFKSCYLDSNTKLTIICNKCKNEFEQFPNTHLRSVGGGCSICNNHRGNGSAYTKEQFIEKANEIHNSKYDYSSVNYKNTNTHIKILCSIHGEFVQTPYIHLQGCGCQKCQSEFMSKKYLSNTDEFIKKANLKHKNSYNYSKSVYLDGKSKIKIDCKKCKREFTQVPQHHLEGQGCPFCNTFGNVSEPKLFDFIKNSLSNEIVISQGKPLWLRGKTGTQSFDVYLPDYNIAIEYQGRQHFKAIDFWGGQKGFEKTKERDARKKLLCDQNNTKLFYFSYDVSYVPKNYIHKVYNDEQELLCEVLKQIDISVQNEFKLLV